MGPPRWWPMINSPILILPFGGSTSNIQTHIVFSLAKWAEFLYTILIHQDCWWLNPRSQNRETKHNLNKHNKMCHCQPSTLVIHFKNLPINPASNGRLNLFPPQFEQLAAATWHGRPVSVPPTLPTFFRMTHCQTSAKHKSKNMWESATNELITWERHRS